MIQNKFPRESCWTEEPVQWKRCGKSVKRWFIMELGKQVFCCGIWPDGKKKNTEWDKERKMKRTEGLVQNGCYCRTSSSKSLQINVGSLCLILQCLQRLISYLCFSVLNSLNRFISLPPSDYKVKCREGVAVLIFILRLLLIPTGCSSIVSSAPGVRNHSWTACFYSEAV